jgi:hypothetical protein
LPGITATLFAGGAAFGAPGANVSKTFASPPSVLGAPVGTAVSQPDGKYIISNLAPGFYTVRFEGSGFTTVYMNATVKADDSAQGTNPIDFGAPSQSGIETFPYPNPVRDGSTQIAFFAANAGKDATLRIYNAAGEIIYEQTISILTAGWWNIPWTIGGASNGIYFYTVDYDGSVGKGKIAIIKRKSRT